MGNACTSVFYTFQTTTIHEPEDLAKLLARPYLANETHDVFIHESWFINETVMFNLFLFLNTVEHFQIYIFSKNPGPLSLKTKEVAGKIASLSKGTVYIRRIDPITSKYYDAIFVLN
jgi:hypothetical protein